MFLVLSKVSADERGVEVEGEGRVESGDTQDVFEVLWREGGREGGREEGRKGGGREGGREGKGGEGGREKGGREDGVHNVSHHTDVPKT